MFQVNCKDTWITLPEAVPVTFLLTWDTFRTNHSEKFWEISSFKCSDILKKQSPEVFCKKDGLINFAKFTRKHLCQSLCCNKVTYLRVLFLIRVQVGPQDCTFIKKETLAQAFPVNLAKFIRTSFLTKHLRRLLLISKSIWSAVLSY